MLYASINPANFESCVIGSFFVLSNTTGSGQSEITITAIASDPTTAAIATAPGIATAVTTFTPQGLPSFQPRVPNVWEIVVEVFAGSTVLVSLVLATYYWRRHPNAKSKMITPGKFSLGPSLSVYAECLGVIMLKAEFIASCTSVMPYHFISRSGAAKSHLSVSKLSHTTSSTEGSSHAVLDNQRGVSVNSATRRSVNAPLTRDSARIAQGAHVQISDRSMSTETSMYTPPMYQTELAV